MYISYIREYYSCISANTTYYLIGDATNPREVIMLDSKTRKEFLYWLSKRLVNKYQEDKEIVDKLNEIVYYTTIVPNCIPNETIDTISSKYFSTFIEKDLFLLGDIYGGEYYSEKQEEIRRFVVSMVAEVFKTSKLGIETKQNEEQEYNHTDEYSFL